MKIFKKYSPNSVWLLAVMIMGLVICTSCSKDDDDDPTPSDKPSNELVGTWYFSSDGEIDYEDYFIFRNDGTGLYHLDDEQSDDFTYVYDSKSKVLTLNYKHWDMERFVIEWLGNNFVDFDSYGEYIRK